MFLDPAGLQHLYDSKNAELQKVNGALHPLRFPLNSWEAGKPHASPMFENKFNTREDESAWTQ
jgi:hypothetical protein